MSKESVARGLWPSANPRLLDAVRSLYERYPYPWYPLWAHIHWSDGYASSSEFAAHLYMHQSGALPAMFHPQQLLGPKMKTVLLAGSGDVLPYIVRKFEPSTHRILSIDLSQNTINRAKKRLFAQDRHCRFIRSDLVEYLRQYGKVSGPYEHIDAYGLFHHLPDPSEALKLCAEKMHRFGTMRMMVYNAHARTWIRNLQKAFRGLHLNPLNSSDIDSARYLLVLLSRHSQSFAGMMSLMGNDQIEIDHRFVDTFMHPREAALGVMRWSEIFESAGLYVYAYLDRYGELDHLPNPLWQAPRLDELASLVRQGELLQNFECYLAKTASEDEIKSFGYRSESMSTSRHRRWLLPWTAMPTRWFAFDETDCLNARQRRFLWKMHCQSVYQHRQLCIDEWLESIPLECAKRLARLGAIVPQQVSSAKWRAKLMEPMLRSPISEVNHSSGKAPVEPLAGRSVAEYVVDVLQNKRAYSDRRYYSVIHRLEEALASVPDMRVH